MPTSGQYAYEASQAHASEQIRKAAEGCHHYPRHQTNHQTRVSHTTTSKNKKSAQLTWKGKKEQAPTCRRSSKSWAVNLFIAEAFDENFLIVPLPNVGTLRNLSLAI